MILLGLIKLLQEMIRPSNVTETPSATDEIEPPEIEKGKYDFFPDQLVPKPSLRWQAPNSCNWPAPPPADADDASFLGDDSDNGVSAVNITTGGNSIQGIASQIFYRKQYLCYSCYSRGLYSFHNTGRFVPAFLAI